MKKRKRGILHVYGVEKICMNVMFSWQEQYLTHSLCSLTRYCSCHKNTKFISFSYQVMFFLLSRHTCTDDNMFDNFPKFSNQFPKISKDFPKLSWRPNEHFLKISTNISEDFWRLSRKTQRCFDHTPTNLSAI